MNHHIGGCALQLNTIQSSAQCQSLARFDFISSDHPGPKATRAPEIFTSRPLSGEILPIAHRAIVVASVAGNVLPSISFRNTATTFTNDDGNFAFVIEAMRLWGTHDVLTMPYL